ncbi:hypothetical protein [Tamlana flava]|uniref:hypothetical protein n=1 Tax=Tamlana flava TaxID=3158572 RepID=UPI00351AB24B
MWQEFEKQYNSLEKSLHGFSPEDVDWFLPNVFKLIQQYGSKIAIEFASKDINPIYTLELLIKAGLRDVDKTILLPYTKNKNEDTVYGAALCLAMCDYKEGFDILEQFARGTHPLQKHIHPKADILPDLKFIDDERAEILKHIIDSKTYEPPTKL